MYRMSRVAGVSGMKCTRSHWIVSLILTIARDHCLCLAASITSSWPVWSMSRNSSCIIHYLYSKCLMFFILNILPSFLHRMLKEWDMVEVRHQNFYEFFSEHRHIPEDASLLYRMQAFDKKTVHNIGKPIACTCG